MAGAAGPDISQDGIVLALDAASIKSFKGEPTENLAPSGQRLCSTAFSRQSSHNETWSYSQEVNVYGRPNATKVTISPTGNTAQPYADWGFAAYKSGGSEIGDIYTISFDFLVTQNTTKPSLVVAYANGYKNPDSAGAASLGTQFFEDLGDGWTRYSRTATITTAGNTWWRFGMNSNNADTTVYVDNFQVELKSYKTRFVDGTRGTTVATGGGWADLSGNGTHGEILNGTTTVDSSTSAIGLSFDGVDDYIKINNSSTIQLSDNAPYTISYFVNLNRVTGTYMAPVMKRAFSYSYGHLIGSSNLFLVYTDDDSSPELQITNMLANDVNKWVHISQTYDGDKIRVFRNGVLAGSSGGGITATANTFPLYIGANNGGNYFLDGKLAHFTIYQKALSELEVLQNYNATKGRFGL